MSWVSQFSQKDLNSPEATEQCIDSDAHLLEQQL